MEIRHSKLKYKNILIVRLSSIGDIVITIPVIENLRRNFPEAGITYLTRKEYSPILYNNPNLSKVLVLEPEDLSTTAYIKFCIKLRKCGYDLIVDLHNTFRSRLLSTILTRARSIHVDKKRKDRMKMVYLKKLDTDIKMVDLFLNTLTQIGIEPDHINPEIVVAEQDKRKIHEETKTTPGSKAVGIHPYAKWKSKEWGLSNYLRVASELSKAGYHVLFFGEKPADFDVRNVDFWGDLSLKKLIDYISINSLYIGNDTGPTHIAAALKIPTIAIFGPTHPSLGFKPTGDNVVKTIHSGLDCSPCTFHGEEKCKFERYKCMEAIKPERIVDEALNILRNLEKEPDYE
ncbi:glycosyltransferase family 9 protein [bacterium]|nr:glycosyltransferase family 9 protein [bacterium]